ncbi:hypothetical protein FD45_GL001768 [Liquorilactobacillus nagelii DSM 13675]|nr:hypothetical protein FD45_GL001768 [Liquorilactobacillus nagelii DSM 13675]
MKIYCDVIILKVSKKQIKNYNYLTGLQQELKLQAKLGTKSISLFSEHGNHSLESLYQTKAPELATTTNKSTSE